MRDKVAFMFDSCILLSFEYIACGDFQSEKDVTRVYFGPAVVYTWPLNLWCSFGSADVVKYKSFPFLAVHGAKTIPLDKE